MESTIPQFKRRPLDEQVACVARELSVRKSVYPKMVMAGKMTDQKRITEIQCMESALETLQILLATLHNKDENAQPDA